MRFWRRKKRALPAQAEETAEVGHFNDQELHHEAYSEANPEAYQEVNMEANRETNPEADWEINQAANPGVSEQDIPEMEEKEKSRWRRYGCFRFRSSRKLKMGLFSRKNKEDGESSSGGLFGRKKQTPQPDSNPYAQQPVTDPYSSSRSQNSFQQGLPSGPRPGGLPSGPGPRTTNDAPPPPYPGNNQAASRYGNDRVGAVGGYGDNRYGTPSGRQDFGGPQMGGSSASDINSKAHSFNSQYAPSMDSKPSMASMTSTASQQRQPGAYGRYGASDDDNRQQLLGGYKPQDGPAPGRMEPGGYDDGFQQQDERTEEDIEVDDIKQQIKQEWQGAADSSTRSNQVADDILARIPGMAEMVAAQGESLARINRNADNAAVQSRFAKDETTRLERLNRSMFVPAGYSKSRAEKIDAGRLAAAQHDAEIADETRRAGRSQFLHNVDQGFKPKRLGGGVPKKKYDLEDTFEDDDGEMARNRDLTDQNVEALSGKMTIINSFARNLGGEVERQNKLAENATEKMEDVTWQVKKQTMRLDRIGS